MSASRHHLTLIHVEANLMSLQHLALNQHNEQSMRDHALLSMNTYNLADLQSLMRAPCANVTMGYIVSEP